MSSQLNVDTIVDKAGSGGSNVKMANTSTYVSDGGAVTQNTVQGLSKYWVFFRNMSILDSFNSASFTDNGTGDATLTITNAMGNINYGVLHGADGGSISDNAMRNIEGADGTTAKTTTVYRTRCGYFSGNAFVVFDDGDNTASFVGDLA